MVTDSPSSKASKAQEPNNLLYNKLYELLYKSPYELLHGGRSTVIVAKYNSLDLTHINSPQITPHIAYFVSTTSWV